MSQQADIRSAIEKAKAIAARLAQASTGGAGSTVSGKRGRDDEPPGTYGDLYGGDASKRTNYGSERPRFGLGSEGAPKSSPYGPSSGGMGAGGGSVKLTQEMPVPQNMAGLVIGRSGENLRRIERETGCRIQINNNVQDENGKTVGMAVITGTDAEVREAKRLIQEIIDGKQQQMGGAGGPRGFIGMPGYGVFTHDVPATKVGLVIGRNGETIKMLQERSGAKMAVVPDGQSDPSSSTRTINISGPDEAVEMAKTLINEIVYAKGNGAMGAAGMLGAFSQGGPPTGNMFEEVIVPNDKVGLVIGRGGDQIKHIQNTFSVKLVIETSPTPENERSIKIYGNHVEDINNSVEIVLEKTGSMSRRMGVQYVQQADPYAAYYGANPYAAAGGYDYSHYWAAQQSAAAYGYDANAYYSQAAATTTTGSPAVANAMAPGAMPPGSMPSAYSSTLAAALTSSSSVATAAPGTTPAKAANASDPAATQAAWEAYYAYYAQYAAAGQGMDPNAYAAYAAAAAASQAGGAAASAPPPGTTPANGSAVPSAVPSASGTPKSAAATPATASKEDTKPPGV